MPALGPTRVPLLSTSCRRLALEFGRFGVVGTIGFMVDTAVLYGGLAAGVGPYAGRVVSYVAAATTTWSLNRAWTFRDHAGRHPVRREWGLFLLVNLAGFASNYGVYAVLITWIPVFARHPVLGVAAGALAGMAGNFFLSRRFVFGAGAARAPVSD